MIREEEVEASLSHAVASPVDIESSLGLREGAGAAAGTKDVSLAGTGGAFFRLLNNRLNLGIFICLFSSSTRSRLTVALWNGDSKSYRGDGVALLVLFVSCVSSPYLLYPPGISNARNGVHARSRWFLTRALTYRNTQQSDRSSHSSAVCFNDRGLTTHMDISCKKYIAFLARTRTEPPWTRANIVGPYVYLLRQ
jgi:hypothetical protein